MTVEAPLEAHELAAGAAPVPTASKGEPSWEEIKVKAETMKEEMAKRAAEEPTPEEEQAWRDEQEAKKPPQYDDVIKWPDEKPPPPEVWEVKPKFDWETEERGYIFEQRLEVAEMHKVEGNKAFTLEQWGIALRRYRRAIYNCHFDEMQMHDFMDHHRDTAIAIQVLRLQPPLTPTSHTPLTSLSLSLTHTHTHTLTPSPTPPHTPPLTPSLQMHCKLNLVACVVKMYEINCPDGTTITHPELPDGTLNHAVEALGEVLEKRPKEAKAHFRKGQVHMLQQDLPNARNALTEAKKLGGHGGDMAKAMSLLKRLEKEEKARARSLYGGKIQKVCLHKDEEEAMAIAAQRRDLVDKIVHTVTLPITFPAGHAYKALLVVLSHVWAALCYLWAKLWSLRAAKDKAE